jgi:hypothetical protein
MSSSETGFKTEGGPFQRRLYSGQKVQAKEDVGFGSVESIITRYLYGSWHSCRPRSLAFAPPRQTKLGF